MFSGAKQRTHSICVVRPLQSCNQLRSQASHNQRFYPSINYEHPTYLQEEESNCFVLLHVFSNAAVRAKVVQWCAQVCICTGAQM